jgi:hypothetical protein
VDTPIAIGAAAVSGLAASATTDTTNASNITSGTLGTSRLSGSYTGITGVGALAAGSLATGFTAVSAPLGGTGQTSYTVGDILYASTSTALSKLAGVAVGNALISGGVGSAPSYGKIGLATHVSGTLPIANGGTGSTSTTFVNLTTNVTGTLPIANGGSGATTAQGGMNAFAGAVTSGQYLRGNGTNVVMAAIQAGDVPTLNQNTTGSAATVTGNATGSTFGFNSGYGSVATAYGCRAWVNFNGTTAPGTIRASGNVTSVTRNGTGDYTINFTTSMPDANYAWGHSVGFGTTAPNDALTCTLYGTVGTNQTASGFRIITSDANNPGLFNPQYVGISVFR